MSIQEGSLKTKYHQLIETATARGVTNLQVRQVENILYIDGTAPSLDVKKELWDVYNSIDPDYRSGDLIMNINSFDSSSGDFDEYTVVEGDNLTKIGKIYGLGWQEIFGWNKDQIKNPDLIQPGWKLKIPRK
jgi:hypothetical protein